MSLAPSKNELVRVFDDQRAQQAPVPGGRVAAVAMVFRVDEGGLSLCIGRRAAVPGDPWSGDLAFPGGKADPGDSTLHGVASRETYEEVGLELSQEDLIGDLGHVPAHGPNRPLDTFPLVYLIDREPAPFELNHEFSDAAWVRLADLWRAGNWLRFIYPPTGMEFPGIRTMNHVLWGYSLRVLHDFSVRMERPLTTLMHDRNLPLQDGRPVAGEHR